MQNDFRQSVRFSSYEVDFRTEEIWRDGQRLKLAGQPFEILKVLLSRPGEIVTREELQKRLWPEDSFVDPSHGLNAAVRKLRDVLGDSADNPIYIETVHRRGYRFIGHLEPPSPNAIAAEAQQFVAPRTTVDVAARPAVTIASSKSWLRQNAAIPVAAAIILGAIVGISLGAGARQSAVASPRQSEIAERAELEMKRKLERLVTPEAKPSFSSASSSLSACSEPAKAPALRTAEFRTIIAGQGGNAAPQFSPDGKRIAFMSNRSGAWQIWLSNADGSDPVQASFTDSAGTPRWSPDGHTIAFDAPYQGTTFVFVLRVDKFEDAQPLVEGRVPSFSRDGKSVYFASDRDDSWQVWRISLADRLLTQVTHHGGFAALESPDGRLYYAKSDFGSPEIWQVPLAGGLESFVSSDLRPRTWSSWAVTREGILFAADAPGAGTHLRLYDSRRHGVRDLVPLESAPHWMGATADGKKVLVNDDAERQITMLDHLR